MPELPTTFGKYFLTEKLATGGMAEIYLGKIVGPGGFEKQLVIKQIHPKLSGQRHFVDLFVAEAKTLVSLAHGNIVPVYELGVVDDTYFIAMDYIDGPTLYRLTEALARRDVHMEPAVAAYIAARILEGLDYAHRKGEGVIHRDLSPRNVMLSRDGEVKLVDFGIAVTLGASEDDQAQAAPTGSFPYMSPEQVRKEALSGQTDLFSVGVLLWEMLVGERLFARAQPEATLAAVIALDIPRPSSQRPEIPAKLDEVVMRALERDQTTRWSSAGDMLAALQKYLYALEDTPGPRDIEALVARFCPPETRRLPTHADGLFDGTPDGAPVGAGDATHSDGALEATRPVGGEVPATPSGPKTAVIPRDAAPRGKRPTRQKSFATHVALDTILERATPMFGVEAIDEVELAVTNASPPASPESPASASRARDPAAPDTTMRIPGRVPPAGGVLVLAGIGATLFALGAVYVFMHGRKAVLAPDAPVRRDAAFYTLDPDARGPAPEPDADPADLDDPDTADTRVPRSLDASVGPSLDASAAPSPPDASVAIAPRDAAMASSRLDAGARPSHLDAASRPHDGEPRSAGTATLKIGADPWADIVIDGAPRGRTPAEVVVPAGHHVVELIYRGDDPPRKKAFPVDLTASEARELQADFTRP